MRRNFSPRRVKLTGLTVDKRAAGFDSPHNENYSMTRNVLLLLSVPFGVVTTTGPVVAPVGIVAVISELDTTVNAAAAPLKVTLVTPVRFVTSVTTYDPI